MHNPMPTGQPQASKPRILCVDDNARFLEPFASLLQLCGYAVVTSGDPRAAVPLALAADLGWQVAAAIETIRPLMGPGTCAIPLMDGVEAPDLLATAYGKERVAAGIAIMLGRPVAPGHIRNTLPHTSITLGELDGHTSERLVQLREVFERAGVHAVISPADCFKFRHQDRT